VQIAPALRFALHKLRPVPLEGDRVAYLRPLTALDFAEKLGQIPSAFADTVKAAQDPVRKKAGEAFAREHPEFANNLMMLFLGSLVAFGAPDDEPDDPAHPEMVVSPVTVVTKPQAECGPTELSLSLLDPDDASRIIQAQLDWNGLTREAGENARAFFRGPLLALYLRFLSSPVGDGPVESGSPTSH
jgi:hypothetical protein